MAVGDVVTGHLYINAGGVYDVRPPSGQEWVIHNIYYNGAVQFMRTDGVALNIFDSDGSAGIYTGYFHCTNIVWMGVKNNTAGTILISWDGVQTK